MVFILAPDLHTREPAWILLAEAVDVALHGRETPGVLSHRMPGAVGIDREAEQPVGPV